MDYDVPKIEPGVTVRWQRWFWRSWWRLILTTIVTILVGVTITSLLEWQFIWSDR